MKKRAWIFIALAIGTVFLLSSIPSLRVLPVISQISKVTSNLDFGFVRISRWIASNMSYLEQLPIASELPFDIGELNPAKEIGQEIFTYARENPIIIEFFLRKLAHIFVFFWITIFLFILINQYIPYRWLTVILANMGGVLLALLDEYRQTFVSGRVGSLVDVLIDSIGVFMAVVVIMFSFFITKKAVASVTSETPETSKDEEVTEEK